MTQAFELRLFEDMTLYADEASDPFEALAQDIVHRLLEVPGSNPDDPDRGLGLEDALSGPLDPAVKQRIEAECRKDPRVDAATALITTPGPGEVRIDLRIETNGAEMGLTILKDASGIRRIA